MDQVKALLLKDYYILARWYSKNGSGYDLYFSE